jgi:(2R)-3-sulfolactate dehydrogenase (NADP+)
MKCFSTLFTAVFMNVTLRNMRKVTCHELESLLEVAFVQAGATTLAAQATAAALVQAEADGVHSHGVSRTPAYVAQLQRGKINGRVEPLVTTYEAGQVHVDACGGFAYPAINAGLSAALERLRKQRIVLLTVGRSHHAGVMGHHVEAAARTHALALGFCNTPAAMAPWGGQRPLFGTNPIAFAAPRDGEDPLVIDLSVSSVARGKVVTAEKNGELIPDHWALDAEGQPTTDPARALQGSMRPMADAKGSNLALMIEILAAALTGSNFGFEASSYLDAEGGPPETGQCFILINPEQVAEDFSTRLNTLLTMMMEQEGVHLPGLRRAANRRRALAEGLSISKSLWREISALADSPIRE